MLQHDQQQNDEQPTEPNGGRAPDSDLPLHSGARGVAVKILTRFEQSDAYLDKLLNFELANGELNSQDKRLLTELTTGVLRWQAKLDWVLTGFYHGEFGKCIPLVKNAMRVALYQILFLTKIPYAAAVNEAVEYVKRLKGDRSASVVNGVLRSIIRKLDAITYPDAEKDFVHYLSIMYSHPQWMVRRWIAQFGPEETEQLLRANNQRPSLSLRVNTGRIDVEQMIEMLAANGATVRRSEYLPGFLRAEHMSNIGAHPAFREGHFTVQDEGAGLASKLTGAAPGMRVIDLCAAPGGKSTAMAEMMEGRGEITAVDKYEAKIRLIEETAARLGLENVIHAVQGDARMVSLEPADVVLVDAPCSGLGVLSKKPDIKWKRERVDIDEMAALQGEILDHAATLVRPGGHLVYSTCTIESAENEEVVQKFLERHANFELVPADTLLPVAVVSDDGFLRTLPHRHGVDGTFGARLRRMS